MLEFDQRRIDDLVARPSEGLNVEIKTWLKPSDPAGKAKLVKAILALRNRNGGFLLIGFDDVTLLPDTDGRPSDVRTEFHLDRLQAVVSAFASESFEIGIGFGSRDSLEFPVVVVPEGVTAPVVAKRDLKSDDGGHLIREGSVYFRTLKTNGTPSTALVRPTDWRDFLEVCFENREADIGRFLRRQLAGKDIAKLVEALTGLSVPSSPSPSLRDRTEALLDDGERRFQAMLSEREVDLNTAAILDGGTWSVALALDPPATDSTPDRTFLNTVESANPQYTGWPVWLDARGFHDETARPRVINRAWQALIVSSGGVFRHLDFQRLDPKGEFYLRRVLEDDLRPNAVAGAALDPILMLLRVAEAIAVGHSFAKALGWSSAAQLGYGFRWTGLKGRQLASWANPLVGVFPGYVAHDADATSFITIPLEMPASAIAPYVEQVMNELLVLFDGLTLKSSVVEDWVRRLLERRL